MNHLWSRRKPRRYLTFSPLAWLKLQFFAHAGETEIGGFGIAAGRDLLYVDDFVTVRQQTTPASVVFDDAAVADHFDRWVDAGLQPQQFSRLWLHTHPGSSALPSSTDEETFQRVFGGNDWAMMGILSRSGQTYARLQHTAGPGSQQRLDWRVDWRALPEELALAALPDLVQAWQEEFHDSIHPLPLGPLGYPDWGPSSQFPQYEGLGPFPEPYWMPSPVNHPVQGQGLLASKPVTDGFPP